MQHRPAALQPALDRPRRPSQPPGCLLLRTVLQTAKDDRQTIALRQKPHFLVEDREQFADGQFIQWVRERANRRRIDATGFTFPTAEVGSLVFQRQMASGLV